MKKTKAIFAIAVVVIVAGASAGLWYLNEHGLIGDKENSSVAGNDFVFVADDNGERDDNKDKDNKHNISESEKDKYEDKADEEEVKDEKTYEDINEYLSNFSRVYFSENGKYSKSDPSDYDVLDFAYTHIKRTDPGSLSTVRKNDVIGYYSCVPYESVNAVAEEFLGITVKMESVPTSDEFLFFEYDDGFFYTPAADGVSYDNITVADKITEKDGVYKVDFTVYSEGAHCGMTSKEAAKNGKKYASGTAEIETDGEKYILKTYKLK